MSTSKTTSSISNNNLEEALKEINSALQGWDKITSHPLIKEDFSSDGFEQQTKDLLEKLRDQINDFSKD